MYVPFLIRNPSISYVVVSETVCSRSARCDATGFGSSRHCVGKHENTRTYMYAYEYAYAYTCIHAHYDHLVCVYMYILHNTHTNTVEVYIREVHKGKRTAFKRTAGRKLSTFCSRGLFLAGRFYASINCKVLKRSYFTVN